MDDDTKNKTPDHLQDHDQHHQPQPPAEEIQDQETEADEALSLSGLILNSDEIEFQDRRRSSFSDPSQENIFEFLSHNNSENSMSHAEDIIFCGKLIPYQENPSPLPKTNNFYKQYHQPKRHDKQQSFHCRGSESLNDLKSCRSNSAAMRTSRSLDYQKLYGNKYNSKSASAAAGSMRVERVDIERSSSTRSLGSGFGKEKIARPRWYMMFGFVKLPPEMGYQDIKSRQVRRNPGSLFTALDSGEKAIVNRSEDRRWSSVSWDLLRVLSCKDHASVGVTASFGYSCAPHVTT